MTQSSADAFRVSRSSGLPMTEAACRAAGAGVAVLPNGVWSMVRFQAVTTVAAGVATYTLDTVTRTAFVYQKGQQMTAAGFAVADPVATYAETNLDKAGTTPQNANYELWGMSIMVQPPSSPNAVHARLLAELVRHCDVQLSVNGGETNFKVGRIDQFPAIGGLFGMQRDGSVLPPTDDATGPFMSFIQNGQPLESNFKHWDDPYTWYAQGPDEQDTSLSVSITPREVISIDSSAAARLADPAIAGVTSIGTPAWTPPGAGVVALARVDLLVYLVARSIGPRSKAA